MVVTFVSVFLNHHQILLCDELIKYSDEFYFSRKFKKEVGIPIHKYILQKRLVYARKRIYEGAQPSKIYSDVGFKDYSSFYKAYLQYFGHSPAKEK